MSTEMIIGIGQDTVITLLMMAAPMLLTGAFIGIFVSMLQTVTQLKDQSLTFIPKIIGVFAVIVFATPFMLNSIVSFTERLYALMIQFGHVT
jgi:flagellar biosynthetic protein FliQ